MTQSRTPCSQGDRDRNNGVLSCDRMRQLAIDSLTTYRQFVREGAEEIRRLADELNVVTKRAKESRIKSKLKQQRCIDSN